MAALGKVYYKGGFEPKMNRREAALILQLRYECFFFCCSFFCVC